MNGYVPWSCGESLADHRPDPSRPLRVERILFGMVRDRCREIGLAEGHEIRYRRRTNGGVALELPDGNIRELGLEYAWFVKVHPVPAEEIAAVEA